MPWLRVREVWLHLVDLDAGDGIDAIPADVAWALAADVAGWMSSRTEAAAELRAAGHDAIGLGAAAGPQAAVIEGSPQLIAGWLTGRSPGEGLTVTGGELPDLPRWL